MAAYVDQPQLRRLHRLSQRQSRITINVYAQLLLLLSIWWCSKKYAGDRSQ